MARELSDDSIRDQALALEDYIRKGGDPKVWLASKDFLREDAYAVNQEWRKLRQAQRSA